MGTTGVALLVRGERLDVANVGDSRAYLVREGRIRQLTQDHSFVWEQVAAGVLTKEQARHSQYRNMITRALGHRPEIEVDFFVEQATTGDVLVLSSDGLHGLLEDAEIAQAVNSMAPAEAVQWLIDEANERGGTDNITVIVAQLEPSGEAEQVPPPLPDAESNATAAVTQPMTAPTGNDDGDGDDDGGSPPEAADAAAPAPAAGWRRASVWGGVLLVVLLVLFGGATFFLGGDAGLTAPPAEPTETPTLSPTRATETPTLSPTRATETPTLSPTRVLTLTRTPRTSPPVAPSFPTTVTPLPLQDTPTISPTVSLLP
jgi:protein phosphatase